MKFNANITVALRPAILDVQGKAVEHALHNLGYGGVAHVRMGKSITMHVEAINESEAKRIVSEACAKLLANPTIEDFHFEIGRSTNGAA